jgi:hypothetical protein
LYVGFYLVEECCDVGRGGADSVKEIWNVICGGFVTFGALCDLYIENIFFVEFSNTDVWIMIMDTDFYVVEITSSTIDERRLV